MFIEVLFFNKHYLHRTIAGEYQTKMQLFESRMMEKEICRMTKAQAQARQNCDATIKYPK